MTRQKKLFTLATLGIILIISLVMVQLTGLIPAVGSWYSYDPALRLQSEAFLRGELAVQPVPYGHLHDWAWGNGMQQVWGLGVPLLQLPFQLAGKLVNGFGFPDRLIFLIFYVFVVTLFWRSLEGEDYSLASGERLKSRLLTLPILLYAFLNHALINMIQGKYEPYEEVISYGFLWSLMLFALLAIFLYQRRPSLYLLICGLAGFALNLRPTIGAYGGMTLVLAFFLALRGKIKFRFLGPPVFLAGLAFFLVMNGLRFGSPFEAGHKLGLSDVPSCNYIVKFDNPMTWISFAESAPELIGGLFFMEAPKTYMTGDGLPWKVTVPRIREINFKPFYPAELFLLVLAGSLVIVLWRQQRRQAAPLNLQEQLVAGGVIWSLGSLVPLCSFYSHWPGLVSRYLVDFAPAIIVAIASLYRYLINRRRPSALKPLCAAGLLLLTVITLWINPAISLYGDPLTATTLAQSREKLVASRHTSGPRLPSEYRCGDQEIRYDIPYNNKGWDISGDCGVGLTSLHFLEQPECLELTLAPLGSEHLWLGNGYSDQEIAVLRGTEPLQRVAETPKGVGKVLTFCGTPPGHSFWGKASPIEMVSIRWLNLRAHPDFGVIPLALLSVKKVK